MLGFNGLPDAEEIYNKYQEYQTSQPEKPATQGAPASAAWAPPSGFNWDPNDPQGSFLRMTQGQAANSDTLKQMGGFLGQHGWRLGNPNASGVVDSIIGKGKQGQDWVIDVGKSFMSGNGSWQWGDWHGDRGGWSSGGGGTPAASGGGTGGGTSAAPNNSDKWNALYEQLMQRSKQGLAVDRNDPVIRAQSDAFSAQQERQRRQYLAGQAEKGSPYATGGMRGQERMTAEKVGQATGGFEAELMGREISARRQEIAEALNGMRGMLSQEQQQALQRELAQMDDQLKRLQLSQQNDHFGRELGLRAEDRSSYWDAIRSGLIN